ncbi:MAG: radical SAM protein [Deltaproteobacteria bacterium]|nr:radical SAM protein [Deltaproteobacteria bacterium]
MQPPRQRYEIHVGFSCCYRCVFCPSAAPGYHRQFASLQQVQSEIDRAVESGHESINFSGGEPSMHPEFIQMVEYAKNKGFKQICVCTNGFGFADQSSASRLLAAGISQVSISVHSHLEKHEERVTNKTGSYKRKIKAIGNLVKARAANQLVDGLSLKTVIHKQLLNRFRQHVEFFQNLGLDDIGFNFIRPDHGSRSSKWVPAFKELTPKLRELVLSNETVLKMNFSFLDIPTCMFPWEVLAEPRLRQRYIGKNFERCITIFSPTEKNGLRRFEWSDERKNSMKSHPAACSDCQLNDVCEGVWRGYLEIYGDGEFAAGPAKIETCFAAR